VLRAYLKVDRRSLASYFGRFAATICHDTLP
jgi:hypothetical protein